ncbi:hypothetical protein EMCRGX_G016658 [Ephydatia muelleri]
MYVAVFVQVIATLSATRGYSTVAPFADCRTIVPNDDDRDLSAPRGTTTVYLDVSALNGTYIPEVTYSLVLSRRVSYNGLLVQGRQASNLSQAAGNFTITCSETDKQRSQCVHVAPESAVTHSNDTLTSNVTLTWTAPAAGTGPVVFLYAVLVSNSTYYAPMMTTPIQEYDSTASTNNDIAKNISVTATTTSLVSGDNSSSPVPIFTYSIAFAQPTTGGDENASVSEGSVFFTATPVATSAINNVSPTVTIISTSVISSRASTIPTLATFVYVPSVTGLSADTGSLNTDSTADGPQASIELATGKNNDYGSRAVAVSIIMATEGTEIQKIAPAIAIGAIMIIIITVAVAVALIVIAMRLRVKQIQKWAIAVPDSVGLDNLVYINNAYSEDISQITRNELPAHEPAEHNGGSKKSEDQGYSFLENIQKSHPSHQLGERQQDSQSIST